MSMKAYKHLPDTYTELDISRIFLEVMGKAARKEYQPKCITRLLNGALRGNREALRTLIGCGGGKSIIFIFALCLLIIHGKKKTVIVAPGKQLLRQLEHDLLGTLALFDRHGYKIPGGIKFLNVSSDSKNPDKKSDEDSDEEIDILLEDDEDEDEDDDYTTQPKATTGADSLLEQIKGSRDTQPVSNRSAIESEIKEFAPTVFFICRPSFLTGFIPLVKRISEEDEYKDRDVIDITVHDEYHNYISQRRTDNTRHRLSTYGGKSSQNWFFSASKKYVKGFCWDHKLFGGLVADVPTWELVKLGYLVKDLKIWYVTPGMIRGITQSIREYFKGLGVKVSAEKFYREAAVILAVMEHQCKISAIPKTLHFGSRVTFLREMIKSEDFVKKLRNVIPNLILHQMDAITKKDDREDIFDALREAGEDVPTLLLQHSVCREGIDCPNFNSAIITRGMNEISLQQAVGRIQRYYVDMVTGKVKEVAHLYVFVDGDEKRLGALAEFIHYNYEDSPSQPEIQPLLENDESGGNCKICGKNPCECHKPAFVNSGKRTIKILKTSVEIQEFMERAKLGFLHNKLEDLDPMEIFNI